MVGLLEKLEFRVPSHFQATGDKILVLGETMGYLGGSAYWADVLGFVGGSPAHVNLEVELALQRLLVAAAKRRLLGSAHDCSTGGLAVALAEAAIGGPYSTHGFGAQIDLNHYAAKIDHDGVLFGEDGGRAVVTCRPENEAAVLALAKEYAVPATVVGVVDAPNEAFLIQRPGNIEIWEITRLREIYFGAIPRRMGAGIEGGRMGKERNEGMRE
jgi:phosphoribosylformylglycinamidine synthase